MAKYDGKTPVLSDTEMRELGFTDHVNTQWYWCRGIDRYTSFNVTIQKDTGFYEELVMDESFGQPCYYGKAKPEYRDLVRDTVDFYVDALNKGGLTITVDHRAYGC